MTPNLSSEDHNVQIHTGEKPSEETVDHTHQRETLHHSSPTAATGSVKNELSVMLVNSRTVSANSAVPFFIDLSVEMENRLTTLWTRARPRGCPVDGCVCAARLSGCARMDNTTSPY